MATKLTKDKKRESNSLSRYFKDLNESDLDSDESDNNDSSTEPVKSSQNKKTNDEKEHDGESSSTEILHQQTSKSSSATPVKLQKLPSALECLNTKSSPLFLKINQKKEINWDHSHKKLEGENDDEGIIDFKTNAVPPPSSYEPVTDPGIKVVDSDGKKRKSSGEVVEDQMMTTKKAYRVERQEQSEQNEDES